MKNKTDKELESLIKALTIVRMMQGFLPKDKQQDYVDAYSELKSRGKKFVWNIN